MPSTPQLRRLETADGRVVAESVELATSMLRRARGLMLRRSLSPGHGLAIRPCSSIHMFFMRFPIDVAFCDAEGKVLRVYHRLRPWRVSRIVLGARSAIELPAGALAAAGVERGSVLRLV